MTVTNLSSFIFTIDDFFTHQECASLIERSEKLGYNEATIQTEKGTRLLKTVRNNSRSIFYDTDLATQLWEKVKPFIKIIGNSLPVGLNEMFRFYKYEAGQAFKKHTDQSFIRNEREASYYTLLIYLNDDFNGGDTRFDDIVVNPKEGTALIFLHSLEHSGATVKKGIKYVLRTDIMFRLSGLDI